MNCVLFRCLFCDVPGSGTCGLKDTSIAGAISLSEGLHHAIDLLSLAWETETPQKLPADTDAEKISALLLS